MGLNRVLRLCPKPGTEDLDKRNKGVQEEKKEQTFLIKYAEIGIKGKNRHLFEDKLEHQILRQLKGIDGDFSVKREMGRIYLTAEGRYAYDEVIETLQRVFGIAAICPVRILESTEPDILKEQVAAIMKEEWPEGSAKTFKVNARRADKKYPKDSMELNALLGEAILKACPYLTVDVHHPDVELTVEIRSRIYLYARMIPGPGGMPVGSNGRALLLLSGGIDSPVAGYRIAKRGVEIDAVYFHAPPYTSERAKQKVIDLAQLVSRYSGKIRLHVVNFTDIQLAIYEKCPREELTIIMRRYMMRIAERFARADKAAALVTGESIGQVASQTIESLVCTDAVCTMPVFRPLIAYDKQEIIDQAQDIGTYATSILPYEDCCTIFVAKHPVTHPILPVIERSEKKLEGMIEDMVEKAVGEAELLTIE